MLGIGGSTPLSAFMTHADWRGVCDNIKTAGRLSWPSPITLSSSRQRTDSIATGSEIALKDGDSADIIATMKVAEKYAIDKSHECQAVFRTTDPKHPGVKMV